jgi:hypothetical protein
MAVLSLKDASIIINSVDLSDRANSVTVNYEIDSIEVTAFGSVGHIFAGGLENNSCEISLMQDYATSNVEDTVYGLVGTTTTLAIKATSGATSATNPLYTISSAFLSAHTPVAGAVGEVAMTTLSFTGGTIVKTTS